MEGRTLVIFNPAANGGKAEGRFNDISKLLVGCKLANSDKPGDVEKIAREYCNSYDIIVAAGGDGTINEVVNGIANSSATLGVIPLGAGNDFRRDLGIKDLEHACGVIKDGVVRSVDLGLVTYDYGNKQRYFCTVLSIGHSAEVVAGMSAEDKKRYGKLAYLFAVKEHLFKPARHARVVVDNKPFFDDLSLMVNVGNSYCAGGGMHLGLGNMYDGLLNVCVVNDLSNIERAIVVPFLYTDSYLTYPASLKSSLAVRTECKEILVSSNERVPFEADGEMLGYLPVMVTVREKALKVLAPYKL